MAEFSERIELLRRVRLFNGLSLDDLVAIDDLLQERRFRKGTVVFEQGDEGDALYIIENGRVKAAIKDDQNREKILGVFGEGDYFGEMALLSDQPRSASMTVVGDAELLVLPKEAFERFLASNLPVMRQFVNIMSRRLAESNQQVQTTEEQVKQVLGKCLVFFSPKGGGGKTTLAVNLAVLLREQTGKSVCVVDCAYPFGDVGVMMNMEPKRTIVDLLPHINELDGEIIESILQTHASGIKVLLAPPSPEETELITAEHVNIIISALRELYEYIIVDTHPSFTEVSISALDTADLILVVTPLEVPALKSVRQFIDTATQKLGYSLEKMAILVNRATSGAAAGLNLADVQSLVGAKVVASISTNEQLALSAINQGVPFAISNKESQLYRDLYNLAKLIAPQALEEQGYEFFDLDVEETPPLAERIRTLPKRLAAEAREGVANLKAPELLTGLGSLLAASAPLVVIIAMLGVLARMLNASGLTSISAFAFQVAIWFGILAGTAYITRTREPRPEGWVNGAILGATYGLIAQFITLAVANAVGVGLALSPLGFLFNVIPFALLGILGSALADWRRPRQQSLLA